MRNLIAEALDPLEVDFLVAGDKFEARTELQFSPVDVVVPGLSRRRKAGAAPLSMSPAIV